MSFAITPKSCPPSARCSAGIKRWTAGADSATNGPSPNAGGRTGNMSIPVMRVCSNVSPPSSARKKLSATSSSGKSNRRERRIFRQSRIDCRRNTASGWPNAFVPFRTRTSAKSTRAMRILDACTGYEYLKELVRSAERRIDLRIGGYIDDNLSGNLSVQQLCSRFRLSHSEIYALFREYFRTTPAEYIRERRLDKACRLLAGTSLPVGKISAECGIPDYNYFSKIFRRTRGVSPRQYRKAAGKNPAASRRRFASRRRHKIISPYFHGIFSSPRQYQGTINIVLNNGTNDTEKERRTGL